MKSLTCGRGHRATRCQQCITWPSRMPTSRRPVQTTLRSIESRLRRLADGSCTDGIHGHFQDTSLSVNVGTAVGPRREACYCSQQESGERPTRKKCLGVKFTDPYLGGASVSRCAPTSRADSATEGFCEELCTVQIQATPEHTHSLSHTQYQVSGISFVYSLGKGSHLRCSGQGPFPTDQARPPELRRRWLLVRIDVLSTSPCRVTLFVARL